MSSRSELVPIRAESASPGKWQPRIVRFAYVCVVAIAMIGWSIALGWASFLLLRLFL